MNPLRPVAGVSYGAFLPILEVPRLTKDLPIGFLFVYYPIIVFQLHTFLCFRDCAK